MTDTNEKKKYSDADLAFEVNVVSGACTAPFWDEIYERTVALDSIRALHAAFAALHEAGKDQEAIRMMFALHDMTETDWMEVLDLIVQDEEISALFMGEFLADTEDLLLDYEAIEEGAETVGTAEA
jgi:hypothetical protein